MGVGETVDARDNGRLLRLNSLPPQMKAELSVDLIESSLHKLQGRLTHAKGIEGTLVAGLRRGLRGGLDELEAAIGALHRKALFSLTAADSVLGRAYALGYELADISLEPHDRCSFENAFGTQVVPVKDRLSDLASSFPPHASRAVVLSLRAWESWAAEPELNGEELNWASSGAGVEEALGRQGRLWRDLLTGDKQGQDMLDTGHYIQAAGSLVATTVPTVWSFAGPARRLLVLLALLMVAGVAIFFFVPGGGKALGTVLALAGAVGITSAGLRARLGEVANELQSQLWGAELDRAIAEAVLTGPAGWDAKVEDIHVPASGGEPKVAANIETLETFRELVATRSPRKVGRLLAPNAEFVPPTGEPVKGAEEVARWVCRGPQARAIAESPDEVEAVAPGILVSYVGNRAAVWRVREEKVRWRQGFEDAESALQLALSLGPYRLARDVRGTRAG